MERVGPRAGIGGDSELPANASPVHQVGLAGDEPGLRRRPGRRRGLRRSSWLSEPVHRGLGCNGLLNLGAEKPAVANARRGRSGTDAGSPRISGPRSCASHWVMDIRPLCRDVIGKGLVILGLKASSDPVMTIHASARLPHSRNRLPRAVEMALQVDGQDLVPQLVGDVPSSFGAGIAIPALFTQDGEEAKGSVHLPEEGFPPHLFGRRPPQTATARNAQALQPFVRSLPPVADPVL